MRISLLCGLLTAGVMGAAPLAAQVVPSAESNAFHLNVAATYSPARFTALAGGSFWEQGGSIQVQARRGDHLGFVADARSLHSTNINSSGMGLDLIAAVAGPRFTFRRGKTSFFGQGLAGNAVAFNGLFPHQSGFETSAICLAVEAGGGVDIPLSRRMDLRAIEANWLYTHLPNGASNVQSALVLGAGVSYWFK